MHFDKVFVQLVTCTLKQKEAEKYLRTRVDNHFLRVAQRRMFHRTIINLDIFRDTSTYIQCNEVKVSSPRPPENPAGYM